MSIGLQIILHMWGDYIIQNHAMAAYKRTSLWWATLHAVTYTLPFALALALTHRANLDTQALPVLATLAIIASTHAVLDRYAPHKVWMKWWGVGQPSAAFDAVGIEQPRESAPPFLNVWLTIIVDNTLHLTINATAIHLLSNGATP